MNERDAYRFACGTELGTLIEQVADGEPVADSVHQDHCPYCRSALRELEQVWGRVRAVAYEELVPPGRVTMGVMRRIRREISLPLLTPRLGQIVPQLVRHALLDSDRGATRIADSVVARIVAEAALDVDGVEFLSATGVRGAVDAALGSAGGGVEVDVAGGRVSLTLHLVARYGFSLPVLVEAVRGNVLRHVEALTGLKVTRVDLTVSDLTVGAGA